MPFLERLNLSDGKRGQRMCQDEMLGLHPPRPFYKPFPAKGWMTTTQSTEQKIKGPKLTVKYHQSIFCQ